MAATGVPCAREGGAEGTSGAAHTDHAGAQANTTQASLPMRPR